MNIKYNCDACGGTGVIDRSPQVGDVLEPLDGSGFPNGLHPILFTGTSNPFKPVRVLCVEGDVLGIVPLHWDDRDIRHKEMFNGDTYSAITWLWEVKNGELETICEYGFWIYAPACHLKWVKNDNP